MTWEKIFLKVSIGAIIGMIMGGLFGFGAGKIAPDLFQNLTPWVKMEPVGSATVGGAIIGVLLGGGLATFGIAVQAFLENKKLSAKDTTDEKK